MGKILSRFVLPMLLLSAALLNWSLLSLVDLSFFLILLFIASKFGSQFQRRYQLVSCCICIFSSLAVLSHAAFYIASAIGGNQWTAVNSKWAQLVGFMRVESQTTSFEIYEPIIRVLIALVSLTKVYRSRFQRDPDRYSCLGRCCCILERIGSHLRVVCYFLLPPVQLVVGISHPSWLSFPFFICSSIGLVGWSLTSNVLGLFRWWRYLLPYAALNIFMLYVYQLPIEFSGIFKSFPELVGICKLSAKSEWSEICSALSLLLYYILLSWIRCDLEEMDIIMSLTRDSDLTEQLLPSKPAFSLFETRSGVRHANFMLWKEIFQTFSINFFAYGFPLLLLALSFWSFQFASLCSLGLLAYVGYVIYAFPSMVHLHRLNGLLLVFILLWAASTYFFNLTFSILNKRFYEDMEIWETIGLWHYPVPGFYLLAQFCLGILVAVGNLVNRSVFLCLSGGARLDNNNDKEDQEERKVFVIATVAWLLRKSSRAIVLLLTFLLAIKPGFIHAAYSKLPSPIGFLLPKFLASFMPVIFFLVYLLSHSVSKKLCRSLVLLCEAHFALLYIVRLNLISKQLGHKISFAAEILEQLGLHHRDCAGDFLETAILACLCSIHNRGLELLFSFSAVVQQTPFPPIGFSILRAGLIKSVIFSVYASPSAQRQHIFSSHERRIVTYLSTVGWKFLSVYHSWGTYISFVTILVAVYSVRPNCVSFGYLFFLLLWISGRQLLQRTTRHLWFPLKIYAVAVFVFVYGLSVFSEFRTWVSRSVDPRSAFGYDPEASILDNISDALIVLISIQLFSYERAQTQYMSPEAEPQNRGRLSFFKRLLVWHSEKILYCAVLYASLSPISWFGFLYLLGLVLCSVLPKSSPVPPKLFLVYSGLLLMIDYQFQLWGDKAEMFPGQEHYQWSLSLGLRLHKPDFRGLESGFRGKVVVIVACIIHYNIFHWMAKAPPGRRNIGKWDEVCSLFDATEETLTEVTDLDRDYSTPTTRPLLEERRLEPSSSWPFFGNGTSRGSGAKVRSSYLGRKKHEYLYTYFWENHKGSHKWNRRRTLYFRRERLHKQKVVLKIFAKYWIENMFSLFGLEINMVVLLMASFAVLNAISLLYIASLAACVVLNRRLVRRLWPAFVFLFASVVGLEYLALWVNMISMDQSGTVDDAQVTCHDCWRSSDRYFDFCKKCWIGAVVDDSRMLISYYMVFMFSCFKLRADHLSSRLGSQMYRRVLYHYKNGSLLSDLSFETKELWTLLDYLRHYSYCHLLDLNLVLILITGTLEYDVLHLGYLGFALLFFRMRVEILKEKNRIFKFLRIYNFALIVLSLAYQSPLVASSAEGQCAAADYVSQVIGFYKYDYGFRITSRSALVEIVIFMLVSVQSYMFSSQEFDYVSKYLEAEQIGAIVREQENRTAWKSAQLQQIRKSEEKKRQRNLQVEKMKSEMLDLQRQLHSIVPMKSSEAVVSDSGSFTRRTRKGNELQEYDSKLLFPIEMDESTKNVRSRTPSVVESSKLSQSSLPGIFDDGPSLHEIYKAKSKSKDKENNPLVSAVNLIGDGVSQVQSLGNLAVNNIATFLNIDNEKCDDDGNGSGDSSDEDTYYEIESQSVGNEHMDRTFSIESTDGQRRSSCSKLAAILLYVWGRMRSNNDVVCYCCFVLTYLWSFSIFSMVYLAALFLYVLCLNTDPGYLFWLVMLIYSEAFVLLQYLYQIIIQHCGLSIHVSFLQELGFPEKKITSSFVTSNLPLFMVYLFTLLQTSIIARDGNWKTIRNLSFNRRNVRGKQVGVGEVTWCGRQVMILFRRVTGGLCRYWKSLTKGAETPPYFVQLTMDVKQWPEDGIQPERIETGMNELLQIMHNGRGNNLHSASKVRIQSIERSTENPNVALVVFEVLYASPVLELSSGLWQESLTPAADVASEILMAKGACIFKEIEFPYPIMSVVGGGKREVDLYAYIFCADLIVFFLVAMFYQSIIKNKSEFLEVYQLEDQFPKEFVFILMVIFFLIVLDRIIYLCSFATGKVLFYLFSFVLFTYSVARYAWYTALPNKPAGRFALRAVYLTKAVSLALQAIQIRFGIPRESTLYRQFLTRRVTKLKYWGFRIYRALPFLYELRCVLDWSCTTTSLTMYDWLKLEDIHSSLFLVKCDVDLNRSKHRHGEKQTKTTKFYSGICLFSALICIIWAPMLMYSSGNPTNIANPIKDASARVDIKTESGRLTLYETSLCQKLSWDSLDRKTNLDPFGYLSSYNMKDVQLICCVADANTLWLVPPAVRARFIDSLRRSMRIIFSWELIRDRPKEKEVVKYEIYVDDIHLPEPLAVMEVLNGTANNFTIYNVYPRFFRVTGSGDVRFFEQEVDFVSGDLIRNGGNPEWWSFHDVKPPNARLCGDLAGPMAVVVSEETPQGILGETLSKFSIWGLYITFVLAVGRFFRLQCADLRLRIPFENLPSCERLLGICEDIYAARAEGELEVEEVLYWTLVKIYRSPHMLLEYTKPD